MALPENIFNPQDFWVGKTAPCHGVVVSSRARYARNLEGELFTPHADKAKRLGIHDQIRDEIAKSSLLEEFTLVPMEDLTELERLFLIESRLISHEMKRDDGSRGVYIHQSKKASIMVNEEDHLRFQVLEPGLQVDLAVEKLDKLDAELADLFSYAVHNRLGYLTACPTNVGTGLRASVMLHLPGLSISQELDTALQALPSCGLTARGFYGENSEHTGDFFQISNEVTLGSSVEEIASMLKRVVHQIIEMELEARSLLPNKSRGTFENAVWRSYGLLSYARQMSSKEALKLLSRVRLGIDAGMITDLTHEQLNRLIQEIQPGHLMMFHHASDEASDRDVIRASLLRKLFNKEKPSDN